MKKTIAISASIVLVVGVLLIIHNKNQQKVQKKQIHETASQNTKAEKLVQAIKEMHGERAVDKSDLKKAAKNKVNYTPCKADQEESARLEKVFLETSAKRKYRNITASCSMVGTPTSIPTYFEKPMVLDWKIQTINNEITKRTEYLEVVILVTASGENIRLEREAMSPDIPGHGLWSEMLGGELVATIADGAVPPADITANGLTIKVVKTNNLQDTYQFIFKSENTESLPRAYDTLEKVLSNYRNLQPQFLYHTSDIPQDPLYNSYSSYRWHLEKVSMPNVWDKIQNSGVTVAVLDTGVNYNHEDLKDNIYSFPDGTHGWDFVGNESDPLDKGYIENGMTNYHGSHCAGIIGMRGNNGLGSVGACYRAKILPIRVFGTSSSTQTSLRVKQALVYCSTSSANVQIASMSFTTSTSSTPDSQVQEALTNNFDNGMRIGVIAAGNYTNNNDTGFKVWPACFNYSYLIKVAASTNNDTLASFSDYGPTSVDIAAPGTLIYSVDGASTNGYTYKSGTSMSTPLVAGALALLRNAAPQKSAAELIACLNSNVDKSSYWNTLVKSGGRMNVDKALAALNFSNSAPYFGSPGSGLKPVQIPNRSYDHLITAFDADSNSLSSSYTVKSPINTTNVSLIANINGMIALRYLSDGDYALGISVDDGYITTEQTLNVRAGGSYLSDGWKASYFYPAASITPVGSSTWTTSYSIWGSGAPSGVLNSYDFAVEIDGYYVPLYTGYYSFRYSADGGRNLWVDDVLYIDDVYDNWRLWGESLRSSAVSLYLNKGQPYKIKARYQNMDSYSSMYLSVKGPYDTSYKYFNCSQYVSLPDITITKTAPNTVNVPFTLSAVNQSPGSYNFIPAVFLPAWYTDTSPVNSMGSGVISYSDKYAAITQATATIPGIYTVGFICAGYSYGSFYTTYTLTVLSEIQQWCSDKFGSVTPTGSSALEGDFDGDGIPNLVEYALGTDPKSANTTPLTVLKTSVGSNDYLTLNINRSNLKTDVAYVVEVSGDLKSWNSGGSFTTTITNTPSVLSVRDNTPISNANRRFMRLAVKTN